MSVLQGVRRFRGRPFILLSLCAHLVLLWGLAPRMAALPRAVALSPPLTVTFLLPSAARAPGAARHPVSAASPRPPSAAVTRHPAPARRRTQAPPPERSPLLGRAAIRAAAREGVDADAAARRGRLEPPASAPAASPLQRSLEAHARPDCRQAYSSLGLLAIVPLVADTVSDRGCRW